MGKKVGDKMKSSSAARFGKWLCKVVIVYGLFILIGLLLGQIPAHRLGLRESLYWDIRMCFMLFGPIYLTLIIKIILTIVAAIRGQNHDKAEQGRRFSIYASGLLLFFNLASAQTVSDFATGYMQGKGLQTLSRSSRFSLKGKRFLAAFFPLYLYLLVLELVTLLVCIIILAPLSRTVSHVFITLIALTALLLLLVPMILSFVSGYQGDKAEHQVKSDAEKAAAQQAAYLVMESDPKRRKAFLLQPNCC